MADWEAYLYALSVPVAVALALIWRSALIRRSERERHQRRDGSK